ncbi:MAG TPA: DUF2510 domain-containing protein [Galbitalea sp.]
MTDDTPKGAPAARRTPAANTPAASKAAPAKRPAAKKTVAEVAPVATAPATPAASAPAGWYPVAGSEQKRWWDGTRWTDHIYDPATATPVAPASPAATTPVAPLRAPEGVKPGTVWFWLLAVGAPVLQLLELIPASIWVNQVVAGDPSANSVAGSGLDPLSLVTFLSGWIIAAFCIVIALLDWRELRARGIPKPFHWAWSFFVIVIGWPVVYVIGRTVVAKRRTGSGMAPLWVFVGLQVVAFIAVAIFVVFVVVEFLTLFSNGLAAVGDIM